MYYNFESSVAVRRSFLATIVQHAKNLPSISTLRYPIKTFERAEATKYFWKGKKSNSKEETVKRIARLNAAIQRLSLRRASKKLEISRQKMYGILRTNLLKKTYKAKIILKLTEHQRQTRSHWATNLLGRKNNIIACLVDR